MNRTLWAGLDIGGTKTAVVLSSAPPDILSRTEFATQPEHGWQPTLLQIQRTLKQMLRAQGATSARLRGIGISCGGPLDPHNGVIQAPPNLPTWIDVPIVDILRREFDCSVSLQNDANAGALAEHRFGAGRGTRNMVFLTLGTGLGSGIIIGGRLYSGTNDMAGEIGHVRLTRHGPVGYSKVGSAEGWASGAGMAQVAESFLKSAQKRKQKTVLTQHQMKRPITARDVGLAAQAGDKVALRIVKTCGGKLGLALAILVDVLNPECIVIGGLAMRLGHLILEPAQQSLRKEALKPALEVCRVVAAELGEKIGDVAALCVAMELDASQ